MKIHLAAVIKKADSDPIIEMDLSKAALDFHRSLDSIQEELQAIDLYHQRADVTEDKNLKQVLIHNEEDEMEHFCMLLEGLRRITPALDKKMKQFLFTEKDLVLLSKD
jgi:hypothetical protein